MNTSQNTSSSQSWYFLYEAEPYDADAEPVLLNQSLFSSRLPDQ